LTASDHSVRLDAAVALARWNLESGRAALERLAADDDPNIRRKTAQAIGKLGDGNFDPNSFSNIQTGNNVLVSTLITLLDDQQDIRRAALQSLHSLTSSSDPPNPSGPRQASYDAASDAGAAGQPTLAEQAARWKQWYSRQIPQR
jgi:HEAT repeat protein